MSYLTPPQTFSGSTLTFNNPGLVGNTVAPDLIQIRNATGWVIQVQALTGSKLIDPFTATTVPVDKSSKFSIIGTLNAYAQLANGYISAEWLLAGESPSEPDGPLTAAATISSSLGSITENLIANVFVTPTVASPSNILLTIPPGTMSLYIEIYKLTPLGSAYTLTVGYTFGGFLNNVQNFQTIVGDPFFTGLVVDCISMPTDPTELTLTVQNPAPGTDQYGVSVWTIPVPAAQFESAKLVSGGDGQGNFFTIPCHGILDGQGKQAGIPSNPLITAPAIVQSETSPGRILVTATTTAILTASALGITIIDGVLLDDTAASNLVFFQKNGNTIGGVAQSTGGNFSGIYTPLKWFLNPGDVLTANSSNGSIFVTLSYHIEKI